MPGRKRLLLLVGAELDQRRAEQLLAEVVDQLRRVRAGVLLVEDDLLGQAEAAAAVLLGPAETGPAVLGEVPVPGPSLVVGWCPLPGPPSPAAPPTRR